MTDIKSLIKLPLIAAAILVVGRVVLEQLGAPNSLNQIFGVAWLYFLVPFYFARGIMQSNSPRPYVSLLATLGVFALITRLFIAPTYWLAYTLNWPQARFSLEGGGVVGADVTPLAGYLMIPLRNLAIWTVMATVVGMILGSIAIAVLRSRTPAASST